MERESFASLDEALDAMDQRARGIRAEGPLDQVAGFREYEPGDRVHARLELATGGLLRGREAGIDVMGDGALVPYEGVVRKRRLDADGDETAFDVVREVFE